MRLGVPVKLLSPGAPKSTDARRWQSGPHLRVSLGYLDAALDLLDALDIRMYRISSDLAPYATHPDLPQFHGQVAECDADLAAIGAKARRLGIRLSFHPSQFVVLNSPDPALVGKSIADLASQAEMLDRMGLGPEAVLVIHLGGTYDDRPAARVRWVETWEARLPQHVKARLVLENDDIRFDAADALWVHGETGVRLVFDHHHHWVLNHAGLGLAEAAARFLDTWPDGVRPKIHFSSPRTAMKVVRRPVPGTKRTEEALVEPLLTAHAELVNPFEFASFIRLLPGRVFDVMVEAKAKDVAVLRLRRDLARCAPDVAARFG